MFHVDNTSISPNLYWWTSSSVVVVVVVIVEVIVVVIVSSEVGFLITSRESILHSFEKLLRGVNESCVYHHRIDILFRFSRRVNSRHRKGK